MHKGFVFSFLMLLGILTLLSCQKYENNNVPIADAGTPVTIQLPEDSTILQGSGSDKDGSIVGYSWSELSGPNAALILTDGAATTTVKRLSTGTYVFQLMVVDNEGATGIDTVSVNVLPPKIKIVTLLNSTKSGNEMYLSGNDFDNYSDPTSPELDAFAWTRNGLPDYGRSLFKFDLSQLPANATITAAKLTLYSNPAPLNGNLIDANSGSSNAMFIQRVVSNWSTSTSWQTQPATDSNDEILIPQTNTSMLDLTDIDVTDMVQKMKTSGNYGFMIRLQNEIMYNSRIFCSSKYTDVSKHPKLEITYY
ncbi:DNRLRE domain-containing protein [Ilyomonas limi]|uniref:DNRLRE domain-containing protein n=1 Tax=Ilyomonas limi TaxID=2575867 RepID=A0A4V5UWH1_9BACT|nr:DNRLRE domain-containing protein [Ilyomonas limi]TKK68923.1 DNRLRE domain-containing protein [Ilyomonas limi]